MHVLTLIHVTAYVGPKIPAGMSLIARKIPRDFDVAPHVREERRRKSYETWGESPMGS